MKQIKFTKEELGIIAYLCGNVNYTNHKSFFRNPQKGEWFPNTNIEKSIIKKISEVLDETK